MRSPCCESWTSPPGTRWTARSTAPATRRSPGCRAARPSTTCAGSTPRTCPPTSSSTTAGSGCTGSARARTTTCWSSARGWRRRTTTASRSRWTAAGCPCRPRRVQRPRNDLWLADLQDGSLDAPQLRRRPVLGRRCPDQPVRRAGRPRLRVHRPGRPARPDRGRRPERAPATRTGSTSSRRTTRPCSRASPSWTDRPWPRRGASWHGPGTRSARSPCTTWRPASGSATSRCRGSARSVRSPSTRRVGTRPGSGTPTRSPRAACCALTR